MTENSSKSHVQVDESWRSFERLSDFAAEVLSAAFQLRFISQMSHSDHGGPIFGLLCIAKPIMDVYVSPYLWSESQLEPCYNLQLTNGHTDSLYGSC